MSCQLASSSHQCNLFLYYSLLRNGNPDDYTVIGITATWKVYSFKPYVRQDDAIRERREYYKVKVSLQGRLAANQKNYHYRNAIFGCNCPALTWYPESYCKHIAYLIMTRYER